MESPFTIGEKCHQNVSMKKSMKISPKNVRMALLVYSVSALLDIYPQNTKAVINKDK